MLTSTNRGYFQLQTKSSVEEAEKRQRDELSASAKVSAENMVFVDPKKPTVCSVDPLAILGIPVYLAATRKELHLGNKGINRIHPNTALFVSLESIVLSDNKLSKLEGLLPKDDQHHVAEAPVGCDRLRRVYLSNNQLSTLKGDLQRLKYIEVLLLANNLLSNMETVSKQLQHLNYLKQLDLFGNPVSEEQSYRLFFIYRHPSLELLDRRSVTAEERAEAAAMFGRHRHSNKGGQSLSRTSSMSSMFPSAVKSSNGTPSLAESSTRDDKDRSIFVFGSSYRPPQRDASDSPRRMDSLSGSAALLESKVRAILLKRSADALREVTKAQAELEDVAEQRRLFHSIWEWSKLLKGTGAQGNGAEGAGDTATTAPPVSSGKGSSGAKGAAAAAAASTMHSASVTAATLADKALKLPAVMPIANVKTSDVHQSGLFVGSDHQNSTALPPSHAKVRNLLNIARQILSESDMELRKPLVDALREHLHEMIPDRSSDGYEQALEAWKAARLPTATAQYTQRIIQSIFTPTERVALQKLFPLDGPPSVDESAWEALIDALDDDTLKGNGKLVQGLRSSFRKELGIPDVTTPQQRRATMKSLSGGSSNAAAQRVVSLDVALQWLSCFLPFADTRPQFFQQLSANALKRGDAEAAKNYFQRYNEAVEHSKLLRSQPSSATNGEGRFVVLTKLPPS